MEDSGYWLEKLSGGGASRGGQQNEQQNSKHLVKYCFQVTLEDESEEEEDTLLMDSWIYLDLEAIEKVSYDRLYQLADKNQYDEALINLPEKFGDELKLPQPESFPVVSSPHISPTLHCISSPKDNQLKHYSSQTVPHFQNSNGLKDTSVPRTFGVCKSEKENTDETSYINVSKIFSSEPPLRNLCNRTETSKQSTDVYSLEVENTPETPDSGISKSFLSTIYSDETSMHSPDVYSLKVKSDSEIPHIHASKLFLHEAVDSVMNPSESCRYSTDMHNVKVENTTETTHSHDSESFLSEAVDINRNSFIKTEINCHSERQIMPVSSENQKRSFSDDETVIVISDDEHSDEDCNIIYMGPYHSLNACDASKHEKPSLDEKMKYEHKRREQTTHAVATNDDSDSDIICEEHIVPKVSDSDIIICEENIVPKVTDSLLKAEKAVKGSATSSRYQDQDVIIEKTVYPTSNPKVNHLVPFKSGSVKYIKKKKRPYQFPKISVIDTQC